MNPLIFQYKETRNDIILDYSLLKYDYDKNLNVLSKDGTVAVNLIDPEFNSTDSNKSLLQLLDTTTLTKSDGGETSSDSDINRVENLLDTSTNTYQHSETSDSDFEKQQLLNLLDTKTLTESKETSDSDN